MIAAQAPLPAGDSWDEQLPSLIYMDWTNVNEDGTFVFASMPQTGTLQLLAICDDWVGVQGKAPFVTGENFEVEDQPLDVELKMEPTFTAKIKIVDKTRTPIAGVSCQCSPNQLWLKGGSTILGSRHRSSEIATAQLNLQRNQNRRRTKVFFAITRFPTKMACFPFGICLAIESATA